MSDQTTRNILQTIFPLDGKPVNESELPQIEEPTEVLDKGKLIEMALNKNTVFRSPARPIPKTVTKTTPKIVTKTIVKSKRIVEKEEAPTHGDKLLSELFDSMY